LPKPIPTASAPSRVLLGLLPRTDGRGSAIVVEPVSDAVARRAAALLGEAGLHGHRHAIDAMLSATALAADPPVTVLTSAPDDIRTRCAGQVAVLAV